MSALTIPAPRASAAQQRYRDAERALWQHYGLAPAEHYVSAAGTRLRVLEAGAGAPLLLVHGTGGPGTWPALVAALSGRRCLMVERPGWGFSEPVSYSAADYKRVAADLLGGVLDALGIEHADVAGASIGDNWALALAQRHPRRVRRAVLLGGGPLLPAIAVPPFIRLLASPLGRPLAALPQPARMVRAQLGGLGHGAALADGRIPDEFVAWRVALSRDTASMRSERAMVRALVRGRAFRPGLTFATTELAAIEPPVLLVHGDADPVGDAATWAGFADALGAGELCVVAGAGHVPWFDEAARVAGALERFLARP